MARISTRRPEDDEIEDVVDEEEDEEEVVAQPVVSDSRRRRMLKRGETPTETVAATTTRKDRPTPSQRAEAEKSSNVVVRFFQDIVEYLKETRSELGKVAWLSREDTLRLTYIVLIVTAASAAFLGLVGFLFGLLTQALASSGTTIIAGVITIGLVAVVAGLWFFRDSLFRQIE